MIVDAVGVPSVAAFGAGNGAGTSVTVAIGAAGAVAPLVASVADGLVASFDAGAVASLVAKLRAREVGPKVESAVPASVEYPRAASVGEYPRAASVDSAVDAVPKGESSGAADESGAAVVPSVRAGAVATEDSVDASVDKGDSVGAFKVVPESAT